MKLVDFIEGAKCSREPANAQEKRASLIAYRFDVEFSDGSRWISGHYCANNRDASFRALETAKFLGGELGKAPRNVTICVLHNDGSLGKKKNARS